MSGNAKRRSAWDKRKTILNEVVTVGGKTATVRELIRMAGVTSTSLRQRLRRGIPLVEAVTTGPMVGHVRANEESTARIMWNGSLHTYAELAAIAGVHKHTIYGRIQKYGVDLAMRIPKSHGGARLDGMKKVCFHDENALCNVSARLGGTSELVRARLHLGWSLEEATTVPCMDHGGSSRYWRKNETRRQLAGLGIVAL